MTILTYPNESLLVKCNSVEAVTPELATSAKEMYSLMRAANGLGLAANQVGLNIRLVVFDQNGSSLIMFNPKILQEAKDKQCEMEACLSHPGMSKKIQRPVWVVVKYRDINNGRQFIKAHGLLARAICHEIEHLDGLLFSQHEEHS
jgi:peptide deformylase